MRMLYLTLEVLSTLKENNIKSTFWTLKVFFYYIDNTSKVKYNIHTKLWFNVHSTWFFLEAPRKRLDLECLNGKENIKTILKF